MTIEIFPEASKATIASIQRYFSRNMDEEIGDLAAGALLGFFLKEIGPVVYNKAVADAQARLQARVMELDVEVFSSGPRGGVMARRDVGAGMGRLGRMVALFLALAGPFADALANGAFWESPHRASANILMPAGRFTLLKEKLDIKLNARDYEVSVIYHLAESGVSSPGTTTWMYFPVLCVDQEMEEGEKPPVEGACIGDFKVLVDGLALRSHVVARVDVEASEVLSGLARKLEDRAQEAHAEEYSARVSFHAFSMPAAKPVKTLNIRYKADYNQEAGGTSKSPGSFFGAALINYDFLPAAAWAGQNFAELSIRLDTRAMRSPLVFDRERWPFVVDGDGASLTLLRPDLATLPLLMLKTRNSGYLSYSGFMRDLQRSRNSYGFSVVSARESLSGHDDVAALSDQNPDTFWCWRGQRATLRASFSTQQVLPWPARGKMPASFSIQHLVTLGLLNGAVRDAQSFSHYGLARKVVGQSADPDYERRVGDIHLDPNEPLSLPVMGNSRQQFESYWLLDNAS
jgi:uncharacterized protein (DUF2164 family)